VNPLRKDKKKDLFKSQRARSKSPIDVAADEEKLAGEDVYAATGRRKPRQRGSAFKHSKAQATSKSQHISRMYDESAHSPAATREEHDRLLNPDYLKDKSIKKVSIATLKRRQEKALEQNTSQKFKEDIYEMKS
jgi:hypothetical protein